jgi:hypothetical protein
MTVLMALSTIASKQTTGTEQMMEKALQVLDYLAVHPDAPVKFRASDMVMNIHADASFLTEPKASSRACRHFFMGGDTKRQQTHVIKQSVPYAVLNTAIRGGVSGRSRTWRPFSEFLGRDDF